MPLLSTTRERAHLIVSNPVEWERSTCVPRGVAAVLAALRFSESARSQLTTLSDADWKTALQFTDHAGLTLILGAACHEHLPDWVRQRMDRNLIGNTERIGRLRAELLRIAATLASRRIPYLLLKGFSQEAEYVADPYLRMPFDIDLFVPGQSLFEARDAVCSLGYQPIEGTQQLPVDHLPPLIRKTGWQWSGDYFDPGNPGCVDLHFQFWDPSTERFPAPGVEEFWERRTVHEGLPVLHPADRLGYAALHLLRHLLRGNVRATHVYEIAYFLHTQAGNQSFWNIWRELHPDALRRLEAVSFGLAAGWFACRLPAAVAEEIQQLDPDISRWFEEYQASPLEGSFRPNKHELWLHFALLDSPSDRCRVFIRRMLPPTLPGPVDAVFVPDEQMTPQLRARKRLKYATHLAVRVLHHTRALPATLAHGIAWKWRAARLPGPFWRLLACSTLLNLGTFQFFLLYNLYLLDLGYRENVLGLIAAAFTAGNLAGVIPAAAFARRYGLKRTLVVCIGGTALVCALRAAASGEPALLAAAFAGGLLFSVWAVSVSPVVAAVTTESARPTAFSITFGTGIGLGVIAGLIGGRLPGWIAHTGLARSPAQSKQLVLAAASASVALALWPLLRLRIQSPPSRETRSYPRGPFIRSFLLAMAVWSFATGLFNPLFNAYFARQFNMPVERIGMVFSFAQVAQAVAIFAAPLVLRRLGLTRGVASMQLATTLVLALLAPAHVAFAAAALYAAYMSFQYMSEPGIYTALMNRVLPGQRSGASALNFLVLFGAQATAASVAGAVVARYGYPPMLAGAAILAAFAAWLFWHLPQEKQ